jgi:hypothetical protein
LALPWMATPPAVIDFEVVQPSCWLATPPAVFDLLAALPPCR